MDLTYSVFEESVAGLGLLTPTVQRSSLWMSLHCGSDGLGIEEIIERELRMPGYRRSVMPLTGAGSGRAVFPVLTGGHGAFVTHAGVHESENGPVLLVAKLDQTMHLSKGYTPQVTLTLGFPVVSFQSVLERATAEELEIMFVEQEQRMLTAVERAVETETARLKAIQERLQGLLDGNTKISARR